MSMRKKGALGISSEHRLLSFTFHFASLFFLMTDLDSRSWETLRRNDTTQIEAEQPE
jgi:hypothetical protein